MDYKTPFKIDNIDLDNVKYTNVKSNEKKTIVYIKYEDNNKLKNLVFQSPTLLNINKAIPNPKTSSRFNAIVKNITVLPNAIQKS